MWLPNLRHRVALITVLVIAAALSLWSNVRRTSGPDRPGQPVNLGLDLQGGIHLGLELDQSVHVSADPDRDLETALAVLRKRVDEFGVTERVVQRVGDRLVVELPGFNDPARAREIVERTAFLQFRLTDGTQRLDRALPAMDRALNGLGVRLDTGGRTLDRILGSDSAGTGPAGLSALITPGPLPGEYLVPAAAFVPVDSALGLPAIRALWPRGVDLRWSAEADQGVRRLYALVDRDIVTGTSLVNATAQTDPLTGGPEVAFELDRAGGRSFARETGRHVGDYLAILLDGRVQGRPPVIESRIERHGRIQLAGRTLEEAHDLALVLRAGALPTPLTIVEQHEIGPSLGEDSIRGGITAGIVGSLAVVAIVIGAYAWSGRAGGRRARDLHAPLDRVAGALRRGAHAAGAGRSGPLDRHGGRRQRPHLRADPRRARPGGLHPLGGAGRVPARHAGDRRFESDHHPDRALPLSLRNGTGPGLRRDPGGGDRGVDDHRGVRDPDLLSGWLARAGDGTRLSIGRWRPFRGASWRFFGMRRWAYAVTAAVLLVGFGFGLARGIRFGVDFTGGTVTQIETTRPPDLGRLRASLAEVGLAGAEVQHYGGQRGIMIRGGPTADLEGRRAIIAQALSKAVDSGEFRLRKTEGAGPKVSEELRGKALTAVGLSFAAVLGYLAFRFEWRYGLAAVLATAHDILATLAFIAILDLEVSLVVVAALLTVVGYSLNDTIVIFDRVRELTRSHPRESLESQLDRSVNETLPRTIMTGGTALVTLVALAVFGGDVIRPFALVMFFGIFVGTFSSVFVASPVLAGIHRRWPAHSPRPDRPVAVPARTAAPPA